jgi:hypothetical protein
VLVRFLARVRRTRALRAPSFWVVFRSLFPPILCFSEGRRRAGTSNDAGLRLVVRYKQQCSLATRIKKFATTLSCPGDRVNGCTEHGLNRSYSLTSQ